MNWLACALTVFLLAMPDTPRVARLLPPKSPPAQLPPGETLPVLPDFQTPADKNVQIAAASKTPSKEEKNRTEKLQPYTRLEIIRYVSGEFVKVRKSLPGGKKGFRFAAGKPFDESELRRSINKGGSVANPGDTVQITKIEFRDKEIVVDINGGGRGRTRFRDRLTITAGSGNNPDVNLNRGANPAGYQGNGSTLILDFGKALPEMSPEDVKDYLGPLLDFSRQRSASVNWVETLPPEFQQAIKDRKAIVGMDREMVVAAMGRPERKVRERDPDGLELEDWIYGEPPSKTIFVTFAGERVIRVKEFPR
ncbi:MAG: hypothetical protein M1453_08510 [Acidobacteria bacterium]|nr:hypothetical protein [Acidobacteriota bacterium]MCL5288017.1 hypothetical protein [Acidobacteriota bacterium]